jgi:RsiW-degrading membrane proteinase PrsW (M82 family)
LCLLPVLGLLATLVMLDSYALVPLRVVAAMLGVGVVMAVGSYFVNASLMRAFGLQLQDYSRYGAPLVEEALKAAVIVWLIHRHRIGFLVDAAILGFALGCGFAVVENLYVVWRIPDAGVSTWIVRGFGTAIMHGGATAAFALVSLAILERDEGHGLLAVLPAFIVAALLHSSFNHLVHEPVLATCVMIVAVPLLLMFAWHRGEKTLGDWLGRGFDADTELLELINSGRLAASPVGQYLMSLKTRFNGPIVADLLCYLRLFTELSLRAKGILLMRENGFEADIDDATQASLIELNHLERTIGMTGLLALHPLLPMRRKALRQLYLL